MAKLSKFGLIFLIITLGFTGNVLTPNLQTSQTEQPLPSGELLIIQKNSLLPSSPLPIPKAVKRMKVIATAYSSTSCQTDDTPFITAANTWVRKGVVANNLLPFGTKIRIPELFGEKIFIVEDRMNPRMSYYRIDIWFPSYQEAKNFGVKTTDIEILES